MNEQDTISIKRQSSDTLVSLTEMIARNAALVRDLEKLATPVLAHPFTVKAESDAKGSCYDDLCPLAQLLSKMRDAVDSSNRVLADVMARWALEIA